MTCSGPGHIAEDHSVHAHTALLTLRRPSANGISRGEIDLSTSTAMLSVIVVPPLPGTEGRLVQKLFLVVAARLLGSRVLSMRLLFVPQWGGGHLTTLKASSKRHQHPT
jgi:hypothetical protein